MWSLRTASSYSSWASMTNTKAPHPPNITSAQATLNSLTPRGERRGKKTKSYLNQMQDRRSPAGPGNPRSETARKSCLRCLWVRTEEKYQSMQEKIINVSSVVRTIFRNFVCCLKKQRLIGRHLVED